MVLKGYNWWLSFNLDIFSCQEKSKKYYYVVVREDCIKRQRKMAEIYETHIADSLPIHGIWQSYMYALDMSIGKRIGL